MIDRFPGTLLMGFADITGTPGGTSPDPHPTKPYSRVYLSPHLDDAALSCGGRIWQQAQAGERVLVVTIFAGTLPPDAPLSPFAQELHARWEHPGDAIAGRRDEDRAALALLGADLAHWPYPDCIYRHSPGDGLFYPDWKSLWGEVHPAENGLIEELASRLAQLPLRRGGALYAPLGTGHHVDHQITHRAAAVSTRALTCYEDFPYAATLQSGPEEGRWQEELVPLSEQALEARIAAVACYRSQISSFWADAAEMDAAVRAFANLIGDDGPAERYWKRLP